MNNYLFASGRGLLLASTLTACATTAPPVVTSPAIMPPAQALEVARRPGVVVLDVRTPPEYAAGHWRGATNLDFRAPDFTTQVARLDTARTYVVYCASGNRSTKATTLMQAQGFRHVVNGGGLPTLKEAGIKVE